MKILKKLLCLTPILFISGCDQFTQQTYIADDIVIEVDRDYKEVSDYELAWESMFDVSSNSYYVYFYSMTCNHCAELKNYIIEKALETKNIYFVKGSSKDQITTDPNMTKNAENPGDIWILGYPSLLQITNYKCIKNLAGIIKIKAELK